MMQQFTNSIAPAVLTQYLHRPTAWRSTDKTNRPKEPSNQPADRPNLTRQTLFTHTPTSYLKVHFNIILPSTPKRSQWSIYRNPPPRPTRTTCRPSVPQAPPISFIVIWSPEKYLKIGKYSVRTTMMTSLYYFFQSRVTSSLFGSSIFVNTLWSNTFSLFFPQCESPCFTSTQNRPTYCSVFYKIRNIW